MVYINNYTAKDNNERTAKMISCQTHDYIEIACLYGFQIRLQLSDGSSQQGTAITTETSSDKREWLILQQQSEQIRVDLMHIESMQAVTKNNYYDVVQFSANAGNS